MSQAEMDKIIAKYDKYDRRKPEYRLDLQNTHKRRSSPRDSHMITFMQNPSTPSKQFNQSSNGQTTLRILDQTQKKLAVSERNYAQVSRKLQKAKLYCQSLQKDLQKQRKQRLQELIDFQNKFLLLETQNEKNMGIVRAKQDTIAILKEKLSQKELQIISFQKQLQEISYKLCTTIKLKEQQSNSLIQKSRDEIQAQKMKAVLHAHNNSQKQVSLLKQKLDSFTTILNQKQKQKQSILEQINTQALNHKVQLEQIRKSLLQNEQNYAKWLAQVKQQKLRMIQNYEHQIHKIKQNQFNVKNEVSNAKIQLSTANKMLIKQMEQEIKKLQKDGQEKLQKLQSIQNKNKQYKNKMQELEGKLNQIKEEYVQSSLQGKKIQQSVRQVQRSNNQLKERNRELEIELEKIKDKCESIQRESIQLQYENKELKSELNKQIQNLLQIKKQLFQANNNQINVNRTLTEATVELKNANKKLQNQMENLTTDLYAQRLQNAKLKEQLQQAKGNLKRQYELSLENVKNQLKEQMYRSDTNMSRTMKQNISDKKKQKLYLDMFSLQRKYQMLRSEVITVDQMTKMGSKLCKYYMNKK